MREIFSRYVLDADVFMTSARNYYAFDLAPGFWQALIQHAQNGNICSIDRVKAEIDKGNDALKEWANKSFHTWFKSTEEDVLEAHGQIMEWAIRQGQFKEAAKAEFADEKNSDAWVIAYAFAKGHIVVTNEVFNPDIKGRIPIPNACRAFNVSYINTFDMLRKLGVRLG